MSDQSSPRAILLDIEGTVAPISFVHEVLFPYARAQMEAYLRKHWNAPDVSAARTMLHEPSGDFSEQSLASLKSTLFRLMDGDVKSTGLKQLQGLIWDQGYRGGFPIAGFFRCCPGASAMEEFRQNRRDLFQWQRCGAKGVLSAHHRGRSDAVSVSFF
jgi:enolase-phosphatase E1